jgi:hypothetical protein
MSKNLLLTVTSLILMLLLTLHIVDDIVRGFDSAGLINMIGISVAAVLVYGTTVLRERLAGQIMMLFIGFFAAAMPVIHLRSARINEIAQSSGGFFFIWTLWALGVIGIFAMIVAAQILLERFRMRNRSDV